MLSGSSATVHAAVVRTVSKLALPHSPHEEVV
jgi:hypothetical protein